MSCLKDRDTVRPNLILFDLGMSIDAALSLLVKLKADEWLKAIPVVVPASADNGPGFSECDALGAAGRGLG